MFTTQKTTNSPQKHHNLDTVFAKTPAKTPFHHSQIKLQKKVEFKWKAVGQNLCPTR
jgi:hypothetical protein